MISSISLKNFKAHADTRVELGQLTMLVGPNGAGKTSVLQALHGMSRLVGSVPSRVFVGDADPMLLARRASNEATTISVKVEEYEEPAILEMIPDASRSHWKLRLNADVSQPHEDVTLSNIADASVWVSLKNASRFRFDAERIRGLSVDDSETPRIGPAGENTATVLATMKLDDDDRFFAVEKALSSIVPQVHKLHSRRFVELDSERRRIGYRLVYDFASGSGIEASGASDGTLIVTALLTVLFANGTQLLLLDDVDQSLHPAAQRDLMRQLADLLQRRPSVQIVATTHSPYILDELSPEHVRVFALREDGTVAIKALSEHPEAEAMKGSLSTGQLWSLDSEQSWVVG